MTGFYPRWFSRRISRDFLGYLLCHHHFLHALPPCTIFRPNLHKKLPSLGAHVFFCARFNWWCQKPKRNCARGWVTEKKAVIKCFFFLFLCVFVGCLFGCLIDLLFSFFWWWWACGLVPELFQLSLGPRQNHHGIIVAVFFFKCPCFINCQLTALSQNQVIQSDQTSSPNYCSWRSPITNLSKKVTFSLTIPKRSRQAELPGVRYTMVYTLR